MYSPSRLVGGGINQTKTKANPPVKAGVEVGAELCKMSFDGLNPQNYGQIVVVKVCMKSNWHNTPIHNHNTPKNITENLSILILGFGPKCWL